MLKQRKESSGPGKLLSKARAAFAVRAMVFLFVSIGAIHAGEVELFCDYAWAAKRQDKIPLDAPCLTSLLRRKLIERGDDLYHWELERYLPRLLNWHGVHNIRDFFHWLGIGIEKKAILSADTKYWVFWNLGPKLRGCDLTKVPKKKLVLVMWEPPSVQPELYDPNIQALFGKIFTWDDDLVDNQTFFKFYYPALHPRISDIPAFEEKKFCTMICRKLGSPHPKELYSERRRAIKFFEGKSEEEFDLYGYGWKKKKFKSYQGSIDNKLETLKRYKFSICYENTKDVKGYISEKIFDCFAAGVVPIYLGASNVADFIPADCFIDKRAFADYEELYKFLKAMTKEEYQIYLDNAARFLTSEKAKLFTNEHFVASFIKELRD